MSRFAEVITYTRAAETLSGTVSYRVCESYYWLRHYDEAIQECTKVLAITEDDHARMRRAGSYEQSGKSDAALQDFAVLADSESEFRNYAAIEMSVIYGHVHQDQKSLDLLNKYTYLFDEEHQSKTYLAISYNNRCYAYMQLGELQKALDDCNKSLNFWQHS
jgi:tetratricopeptide (TPR) repeat protein